MRIQREPSDALQIQTHTPEYIDSRILEISEHFDEKVRVIRDINDKRFQVLCLFSLIESLVQEYSNYRRGGEQQKFTTFVLKFQNKWDFLRHTDPVTLFYEVQDHLDDDINLEFMSEGCIYSPDEVIKSGKTEEIIAYLKTSKHQNVNELKERHRYVDLLYRLRSKLSHESSAPGWLAEKSFGVPEPLPYYTSCSRRYSIDGKAIEDHVWELVMPVELIKQLLYECLENYLKSCEESQRVPFSNNKFERKFRLAWYD